MRAHEFITEQEKLDEVLPLIVGAARGAAGALAKGAAKQIGKAVGSAVKGTSGAVSKTLQNRNSGNMSSPSNTSANTQGSNKNTPQTNNPNAKVGTQSNTIGNISPQQTQQSIPVAKTTTTPDTNKAKDQLLRPGSSIQLPIDTKGTTSNFAVTKVAGDEIEIDNPQALKDPSQPKKLIYKKSDLKKSMSL
jgi:hypothetical protein